MNASIEEQLHNIDARLARLEKSLGISAPPRTTPTTNPTASPSVSHALNSAQSSPTIPSAKLPLRSLPPIPTQEAKPGNWLGIIGIICFILAAGFIIKLSIDTGWLTPGRQVGLATLLGLCCIGGGLKFQRHDLEYMSLLPAAGIIILYACAFASHKFYALVSIESALALTSIITGLCIWLYTEIEHDLYAITSAVGAYTSPVILELNAENSFTVYYFLLCSLGFSTISIGLKSRLLSVVACYLAILITGTIGMEIQNHTLVTLALSAHFLIFAMGTYFFSKFNDEVLTEKEANSFLPVLLIFYAFEYYFIDRILPGLAPWISLGFAGFLLGLYSAAKNLFPGRSLSSLPVLLNFTTIVAFHSIYLELLPLDARPWLFVLTLLGTTLIPQNWMNAQNEKLKLIPLALTFIVAIEYISMLFHVTIDSSLHWLVVSLASVATLWFLLIKKDHPLRHSSRNEQLLLGSTHVLAIVSLYRLGDPYGSLAVSCLWLLYSGFVIAFAFSTKDQIMAKSALLTLGFAAAKALLYDAASAPTIVRIVCLLLTGAVLYGSGFLLRRISHWKKTESALQ